MIPEHIHQVFPNEHKEFLESFFKYCPSEVFQQISIEHYPKQYQLIRTYEDTRYIFFLLSGKLRAIEERVTNIPYSFTEINAIDIVGDYEVFTEISGHYVALTTALPSLFLKLPAHSYRYWMLHDVNALFMRTQMLVAVLSHQTQQQRKFLGMNTTQKLQYYLYEQIQKKANASIYKIDDTREFMSAQIGCSMRQLNRIFTKLQQINMLHMVHGKVTITSNQMEHIKKAIEEYL